MIRSSKEIWDSQYQSRQWEYLTDILEVPRYSVILGFLLHGGCSRVLDIGCGQAIVLSYLRRVGYRRYVGIDISSVALATSASLADDNTEFVTGDIESLSPLGQFDAVLFNECLYYFVDPLDVIRRCTHSLTSGGIFIVSLFLSQPIAPSVRLQIQSEHRCLEEVLITNTRGCWSCSMYAPPLKGPGISVSQGPHASRTAP